MQERVLRPILSVVAVVSAALWVGATAFAQEADSTFESGTELRPSVSGPPAVSGVPFDIEVFRELVAPADVEATPGLVVTREANSGTTRSPIGSLLDTWTLSLRPKPGYVARGAVCTDADTGTVLARVSDGPAIDAIGSDGDIDLDSLGDGPTDIGLDPADLLAAVALEDLSHISLEVAPGTSVHCDFEVEQGVQEASTASGAPRPGRWRAVNAASTMSCGGFTTPLPKETDDGRIAVKKGGKRIVATGLGDGTRIVLDQVKGKPDL